MTSRFKKARQAGHSRSELAARADGLLLRAGEGEAVVDAAAERRGGSVLCARRRAGPGGRTRRVAIGRAEQGDDFLAFAQRKPIHLAVRQHAPGSDLNADGVSGAGSGAERGAVVGRCRQRPRGLSANNRGVPPQVGGGKSAPGTYVSFMYPPRRGAERHRARSQKPEARSQKPEARSQKPEARSQKPEATKLYHISAGRAMSCLGLIGLGRSGRTSRRHRALKSSSSPARSSRADSPRTSPFHRAARCAGEIRKRARFTGIHAGATRSRIPNENRPRRPSFPRRPGLALRVQVPCNLKHPVRQVVES